MVDVRASVRGRSGFRHRPVDVLAGLHIKNLVMGKPGKKSRLVHAFRVPGSVRLEVLELLRQVDDLPRNRVLRVLAQLVVGSLSRMESNDHARLREGVSPWVPVPYDTRRKLAPDPVWKALVERGAILLKVGPSGSWYSKERGQCAEYALPSEFLRGLVVASFREAFSGSAQWVDLITGVPTRCRRTGERDADILDEPGIVLGPKVTIPLAAMKMKADWMLLVAEAAGRPDLRQRALRAMGGLVAVVSAPGTTRHRDGWATIVPRYREHPNGRRYGLSGSLQGLPKELKQVILSCPCTPWKNYDMSVAHVAGLLRFATAINSVVHQCTGPYDDYIDTDMLKQIVEDGWDAYVDRSGLPKRLVKRAVLSLIMGSRANFGGGDFDSAMGAALKLEARDVREQYRIHQMLKKFLKPLIRVLSKASDHVRRMLEGRWYKLHGVVVRKNGRHHELLGVSSIGGRVIVRNILGGLYVAHTKEEGWSAKDGLGRPMINKVVSQAMSHVLTGIERQFMGEVIEGCRALGIPFLDEHDGVSVCGELPEGVVEASRRASVLANYACLRPKPFLAPEEDEYERLAIIYGISPFSEELEAMTAPLSLRERRRLIGDAILADPARSDRDIGRQFACAHPVVGRVRRRLIESGDFHLSPRRVPVSEVVDDDDGRWGQTDGEATAGEPVTGSGEVMGLEGWGVAPPPR